MSGCAGTRIHNFCNPMAVHRTALSLVRGDPSEHLEQQDFRESVGGDPREREDRDMPGVESALYLGY